MATATPLQMGYLALKGQRFSEAEQQFLRLLQSSGTPDAWCGLGLAKLGKLFFGKSAIDEVLYCFEQFSHQADESQGAQAKSLVSSTLRSMLDSAEELLSTMRTNEGKFKQQAASGLGLRLISAVRGRSSSALGTVLRGGAVSSPSLFTNLDALLDSRDGHELMKSAAAGQQKIENLYARLKAFCKGIEQVAEAALVTSTEKDQLIERARALAASAEPPPVVTLGQRFAAWKESIDEQTKARQEQAGGKTFSQRFAEWKEKVKAEAAAREQAKLAAQEHKQAATASVPPLATKVLQQCPSCGAKYQISAAHVGKRLKCAKCGNDFRAVQLQESAAATKAKSNTPRSKGQAVLGCGLWILIALGVIGYFTRPENTRSATSQSSDKASESESKGRIIKKTILLNGYTSEDVAVNQIADAIYSGATAWNWGREDAAAIEVEVWMDNKGLTDRYGNDVPEDKLMGTIRRTELAEIRKYKSAYYWRTAVGGIAEAMIRGELRRMPNAHLLRD